MISIACLIYRSTKFADATWNSLMEHTPHLHDGRARFFFVANDATPAVIDHLTKRNYPFVVQNNKHRSEVELVGMGYAGPDYIHRVYRAWNRAIIESEEQLVLINSDMEFSPGWLEGLEEVYTPDKFVTSTLVERWAPKMGNRETGPKYFIEADFGDHPDRFNRRGWYAFSQNTKKPGSIPGRHYACIMFSRSKAIEAGLYPEGNLFAPWGIYAGDRAFVARLGSIGVQHVESTNSVVYHYNEGEMEDTVQENNRGISIIVPCDSDRYEMFKTTYGAYMDWGFPQNIQYEFILVSRTIFNTDLPNVKIVNYTHGGQFFNASKALNLGVKHSKYSTIFVTCPEVKPITNIVDQYLKLPVGNYICRAYDQGEDGTLSDLVRTSHRDHIPSMYFLGIFKKDDILKINGWDEDFMAGFSWEDIDFGERFTRAGLKFSVKDDLEVVHMYHPRWYHTNGDGWNINWGILQNNIKNFAIQCKNGIEKL